VALLNERYDDYDPDNPEQIDADECDERIGPAWGHVRGAPEWLERAGGTVSPGMEA